jgi:opacity protein-like surface antigen
MKNTLILSLGLIALPALAQPVNHLPEGFYFGGSLGYAHINPYRASPSAVELYVRSNDNDVGYKLLLGHQFDQRFAIEASFVNLGKSNSVLKLAGGNGLATGENKVSAITISAKFYAALNTQIKPYLAFGYSRLTNEQWQASQVAVRTDKKTNGNLYYGIGFDYPISQKMKVGFGYESFGKAGDKDETAPSAKEVKPTMWSLSITSSF